MSQADKFFQMCTMLPAKEVKDERDESSVPELEQIAELRDSGSTQEAIDYGTALIKMYPDNDLIPFMLAYIYYQKEFPAEALQMALEAIPKCPRKYRLYSVAGLAEFDRGRLPEALVWWSRSVIAQATVTDYQEYDPFLHLAHTAEIIDVKREAEIFFMMADAIEPSSPRLDDEAIAKLAVVKNSWVREPLTRVLQHIDKEHLHGK